MTGTPQDEGSAHTHVGEWADLIGDRVPDSARRERTLADRPVPPREDDDPDPTGAS